MRPFPIEGRPFRTALPALLALLGAACTAAPRRVAVAGGGSVIVYDGSLAVADTLPLDASGVVLTLQFAPDGTSLYVATNGPDGGELRRLRQEGGQLLGARRFAGRRLDAFLVAPDARSVLAAVSADSGSGSVIGLVADLTRSEFEIAACEGSVRAVAAFEPADLLYALCDGDVVATIDLALGTVVRTATFGAGGACGATDLAVSANGTVLFALCPAEGWLLYLDHRTLAVLDTLPVGQGPVRLVRSPDGRRAVFPCAPGQEIVTASLRERRTTSLRVPFVPQDVAIAMDGRTAFAAGGTPGTLALVDLVRGEITMSVPTVPAPHRVAVWPAPRTPVMWWNR